jgi:hypothetical protein
VGHAHTGTAVIEHKFKIGQPVNYLVGRDHASGVYTVNQLLPQKGGAFRYCIKNLNETHERVAKERELRSACRSSGAARSRQRQMGPPPCGA